MKLKREFYSKDTKGVAREILGEILVHKAEEGTLKGKIVEVEAYLGLDDPGARELSWPLSLDIIIIIKRI
jgi:DNA-3-methyladenine glycosylase